MLSLSDQVIKHNATQKIFKGDVASLRGRRRRRGRCSGEFTFTSAEEGKETKATMRMRARFVLQAAAMTTMMDGSSKGD